MPDRVERKYWGGIFEKVRSNEIDSWAYPWTACIWYHGGLTATPNINLVSNIGYGPDGTHTISDEDQDGLPTYPLGTLIHPDTIEQDLQADRYVFDHHFGGLQNRIHRRLLRLAKRFATKLIRSLSGVTFVNIH